MDRWSWEKRCQLCVGQKDLTSPSEVYLWAFWRDFRFKGVRGHDIGAWTHHWSYQERGALSRVGACWCHGSPASLAEGAGPPTCWRCPCGRCSSEPCTSSPLQMHQWLKKDRTVVHLDKHHWIPAIKMKSYILTHFLPSCPPGSPTGWAGQSSAPIVSWDSPRGSYWCRPRWAEALVPTLQRTASQRRPSKWQRHSYELPPELPPLPPIHPSLYPGWRAEFYLSHWPVATF